MTTLLLAALSGCTPPASERVPGVEEGGTGLSVPDPPTRLEVLCTPTANALRQSCSVTIDPPQAVGVSVQRADGAGPARIFESPDALGTHDVGVYLLAPDADYTVEATATAWPDERAGAASFATGVPPKAVGSWLVPMGVPSFAHVGTENPCAQDAVAVIYDTATGELVWYEELDPEGNLGVLDMVRFTDERTVLGETDGHIVEVDRMGADVQRFAVDYPVGFGMHHDVFKKDGITYGLIQDWRGELLLDVLVLLDDAGAELARWHPRDHLPIPADATGDWLHTNTVWVEDNGDFLLSFLAQRAIGAFVGDPDSPDFGRRKWIASGAPEPGPLGSDIALDWSYVPGRDSFLWQHNLNRRADGRLQMLDNMHGRALVFDIDAAAGVGHVDSVYPTVEPACGAQGTAQGGDGDLLVACSQDTVRAYDVQTAEPVWQARVECRMGSGPLGPSAARWYPLDGWD